MEMIRIDREKVAFGVSRFNAGGCICNCTWFFTWADGLDLRSGKLITRWTARLRKVEMSSSSS